MMIEVRHDQRNKINRCVYTLLNIAYEPLISYRWPGCAMRTSWDWSLLHFYICFSNYTELYKGQT
jgi:hypothetical protein